MENSNDKRQQAKGRKTEYFLGNGTKVKIPSEIKPPLDNTAPRHFPKCPQFYKFYVETHKNS